MKNKIKSAVLLLVICPLFLAACFNDLQENESTLSISVGGGNSRIAISGYKGLDSDDLTHIITLDGPGGSHSRTIPPPGGTAYFSSLEPGNWNVHVEAFRVYDDNGGWRELIAVGNKSVTIKPGKNSATVTMGDPL
ncbi:MAG: hypothetical protein LBB89_03560 [Treponema sp.]|nr:hypothetical protein [Treponema sp.]